MLRIAGLQAAYGSTQVLFDVSLEIDEGDMVALMGRNGMGKTTVIRSIFGLTRKLAGSVHLDGLDIGDAAPHQVGRRGLALVPEGRRIFVNLTVYENLVATARPGLDGKRSWALDDIFDLFPVLAERRDLYGRQLSGGEQQMLAIGRALLTNPRLLVLDEATEGLAPIIRAEIWQKLIDLSAAGQTILVVDPDAERLVTAATKASILENGCSVWQGQAAALQAQPEVAQRYLSAASGVQIP